MRFGKRFASREAEHLQEAVRAFMPITELTLDFSAVREFEDAAIVPLARTLAGLSDVTVRIHGLTMHQWRVLGYFGIRLAPPPALDELHPFARA